MNVADDLRPIVPIGAAPSAAASERAHDLLVPVPLPFHLPTPVYGAMLAIWHLRPVLQSRFPIHKGNAREFVRFLAWCASEGRREYTLLREIPEWDAALARPIHLPELRKDDWAGMFSVAMFLFGVSRFHYTVGPMLRDPIARHRVARVYWRGERHARALPPPPVWQLERFGQQFGSMAGFLAAIRIDSVDGAKGVAERVMEFGLADLADAFADAPQRAVAPTADGEQVRLPAGLRRSPLRLPLRVIRPISSLLRRIESRPSEFQVAGITGRISVARGPRPGLRPAAPFGVNLFGYARGEIGIGEDVRMVALALKAHDIPFCIVNVQPGANVSQLDTSVEAWIAEKPRYAINIFCTTGIEQTRYACEQGLDVFRGRYTIGLWPWELPHWPASCNHAYSLVDEIWAISRYTAGAYRDAQRPVYTMSLPVTVDPVANEGRAEFGLPVGDYLFVYSFDFNSTLSRKNPKGVIRAFQRAFPPGRKARVGLVIKASHVCRSDKKWARLNALIQDDPRIHLIDGTLRRPQVLALYRCCDCFVSLHRAEGFGRSLAEALLLDLQLIATDFSGNLDFCSAERVGLVRYKDRDLVPEDYFFADGQCWAEPDVTHAAQLMREVRANPRPVLPRDFDFSPAAVGARYAQRLHALRRQLHL